MDVPPALELEVSLLELEAGLLVALSAAGFPADLARLPTVAEVRSRTTFAGIEGDVDQAAARAVGIALGVREQVVRQLLTDLAAEAPSTQEVLRRLDALVGHVAVPATFPALVDAAAEELRVVYAELAQQAARRIVEDAAAAGIGLVGRALEPDDAVVVAQARRVAAEAVDAGVRATRGAAHATARPPGTRPEAFLRAVLERALDEGTKGLEDVATQGALAVNGSGRLSGGTALAPTGFTWYASELLDRRTCAPCSSVDGREYATREEALADYPSGRYVGCKGGDRCRGTLVAVPASEAAPSLRAPGQPQAPGQRAARTA